LPVAKLRSSLDSSADFGWNTVSNNACRDDAVH
jgi:hypothetical protein